MWSWVSDFRHRVTDDFAPETLTGFVDQWEAAEKAGRKSWGIYRDGELGGVVTAADASPMLCQVSCIFKPSFWKGETPRHALTVVLGEIFGGATKASMAFFADNRALISLAHQLGGVREGLFRRHTMRAGKLADVVVIGIQKEAFGEYNSKSARDVAGNVPAHVKHNVIDPGRSGSGALPAADEHKRDHELDGQQQLDGQQLDAANPDALPVVAAAAAVPVHHAVDAEPASRGSAVRQSGA